MGSSATTGIKSTGMDARRIVALRRVIPAYTTPLRHFHAGPMGTCVRLCAATGCAWASSCGIRITAMTGTCFLETDVRPLAYPRMGGGVTSKAVSTSARRPVVMAGFHLALNSAMMVTTLMGTGVARLANLRPGGHAQRTSGGSHGAGQFAAMALSRAQKNATTEISGHTMVVAGGVRWSVDGCAHPSTDASRFAAMECARGPRLATMEIEGMATDARAVVLSSKPTSVGMAAWQHGVVAALPWEFPAMSAGADVAMEYGSGGKSVTTATLKMAMAAARGVKLSADMFVHRALARRRIHVCRAVAETAN